MKPINDGGPAFPLLLPNSFHAGMTLRQYWAGEAMKGMLGDVKNFMPESSKEQTLGQWLANQAFEMTDAMLAHEVKEWEAK